MLSSFQIRVFSKQIVWLKIFSLTISNLVGNSENAPLNPLSKFWFFWKLEKYHKNDFTLKQHTFFLLFLQIVVRFWTGLHHFQKNEMLHVNSIDLMATRSYKKFFFKKKIYIFNTSTNCSSTKKNCEAWKLYFKIEKKRRNKFPLTLNF